MTYTIDEIKEKVKPIADKYDVKEMYLFGSYARNEAGEYSDLDIAVQEEGTQLVGMKFITFQIELEETLKLPVELMSLDCVGQSPIRFDTHFSQKFETNFEKDKVALI